MIGSAVVGPGGDQGAAASERHASHWEVLVARRRQQNRFLGARRRVPQPNGPLVAGRRQQRPVRGVGEGGPAVLVAGERPGRESPDEITYYKSIGVPIQDIWTAQQIEARAVTVAVKDQFGNTFAADSSSTVTLTLNGGTLSSGGNTATATVASGVATFSNLVLAAAGSYTLTATDPSNASRTLLLDTHSLAWSHELSDLFGVPLHTLPEVRPSAGRFGTAALDDLGPPAHILDGVPVSGVLGDQQAALFGQACFQPGMVKSTYGTGCFALLNTGRQAVASRHKLLTTIAYQWRGERVYALEGSIFSAGATMQ